MTIYELVEVSRDGYDSFSEGFYLYERRANEEAIKRQKKHDQYAASRGFSSSVFEMKVIAHVVNEDRV